ncbi:hypothetical protein KP509_21G032000 [Ceratopteris richardii]|uniref:HAT C-terminal dimerisation domain-containing protein n=1 Tax=Ceratopteris richardii TaxID=49495 RepID=A0A8T2SBU7_CERRI|nr:hypothetical protein KP509_21G032000 [Ceratopteris richardii]
MTSGWIPDSFARHPSYETLGLLALKWSHSYTYSVQVKVVQYGPDDDGKVNDGWMNVIERYTHGDLEKLGVLMDELYKYKSIEGTYQRPLSRDEKRMHYAMKWWESFRTRTPNLQKLALRVLSKGTCASPCERNWSTFSLIHTKLRTKLLPKNTEKLDLKRLNFEVTLDMIEDEKDDDRLLILQKSKEGEDMLASTTPILERLTLIGDDPLCPHDDNAHDDDDDDEDDHDAHDDDDDDVEEEDIYLDHG